MDAEESISNRYSHMYKSITLGINSRTEESRKNDAEIYQCAKAICVDKKRGKKNTEK